MKKEISNNINFVLNEMSPSPIKEGHMLAHNNSTEQTEEDQRDENTQGSQGIQQI